MDTITYTYEMLRDKVDYIPNDFKRNLQKALRYLDPEGSGYDDWNDIKCVSRQERLCCCSHPITISYTILHSTKPVALIVGSACIKHFGNTPLVKQANLLLRKHNNPYAKYCELCERKVSNKVVDKYKNKKHIYHKTCLAKTNDKCGYCRAYSGYDCECKICVDCPQIVRMKQTWAIRCVGCWKAAKNIK